MLPASEEDLTPTHPPHWQYGAPSGGANVPPLVSNHIVDASGWDSELPTMESINIHPRDECPPVIFNDEYDNVIMGQMQDLNLLDSLVNPDTNIEAMEYTI